MYKRQDFRKAFDSIDRNAIKTELTRQDVGQSLNRRISQLFVDEKVQIIFNGKQVGEVIKNKGIKQGCKISPLVFIWLVNQIINDIDYKFRQDNNNVQFFADDCIIIAKDIYSLDEKLRVITRKANNIGLKINMDKSNYMIYNNSNHTEHLDIGINPTDNIKYLGVHITNHKACFQDHISIKKLKSTKYVGHLKALISGRKLKKTTW